MQINDLQDILSTQSRSRTGTSFTPLVFETSASTDSAIWAFGEPQFRDALVELRCKDTAFFKKDAKKTQYV